MIRQKLLMKLTISERQVYLVLREPGAINQNPAPAQSSQKPKKIRESGLLSLSHVYCDTLVLRKTKHKAGRQYKPKAVF